MKLGSGFLFFLMTPVLFATPGFAATEILRPVFTKERQFLVQEAQPAEEIVLSETNIKVLIFKKAQSSCGISTANLQRKMQEMLSPSSSLWKKLDPLFPNSFRMVESQRLQILIDNFSDFGSENPIFASYFLRRPLEVIGLDCSARAQAYWLPSLAHEITHALLADRNVESWFEEGLAQLIETQAGGQQPELTLNSLAAKAPAVLSVREQRRPLPDRQSYAMSFLFTNYLHAAFGGWAVLREMITSAQSQSSLDGLIAQAAPVVPRGTLLGPDKMTRAGLLRYFYMSLVMNNSEDKRYKIPGWEGFRQAPRSEVSTLIRDQAAYREGPQSPEFLSKMVAKGYEVYRVQMGSGGAYIVTAWHVGPTAQKPSFLVQREFTLIINTKN